MSVNKYKLLKNGKDLNLNLPISQDFSLAGQEDIIKRDFVNVEVDKSINEIIDYEKVKLLPKNIDNNGLINKIIYKLNFLDENGNYNTTNSWYDLGFNYKDFKFRKNVFIKSHLRLDFFDSDILSRQRLLSFVTLYPKFYIEELKPNGSIPQPNEKLLNFTLGNTVLDKKLEGEGFSLYYFKDEIIPTVNKNMFMVATFNNAKTGKSTKFMSSNNLNLPVDELIKTTDNTNFKNNLHTKYLLIRDVSGFYYKIDTNYSNNVINLNNDYVINLYEINSI